MPCNSSFIQLTPNIQSINDEVEGARSDMYQRVHERQRDKPILHLYEVCPLWQIATPSASASSGILTPHPGNNKFTI